jgi:hypothetical protein
MLLAPICILYCKQCITMNEYKICSFSRFGFPGEKSMCNVDPGDQILLKIQSDQNRFKSNGCICLIIMNPTQLERVQTDIR